MPWQWVSDLLTHGERKKTHSWDVRCPLFGCPSNMPYRGIHKPRLKYVQSLGLFIYQYKCKDCGNIFNVSTEKPNEESSINRINPGLFTSKPDYKFHV